jgi:hypothetical protein
VLVSKPPVRRLVCTLARGDTTVRPWRDVPGSVPRGPLASCGGRIPRSSLPSENKPSSTCCVRTGSATLVSRRCMRRFSTTASTCAQNRNAPEPARPRPRRATPTIVRPRPTSQTAVGRDRAEPGVMLGHHLDRGPRQRCLVLPVCRVRSVVPQSGRLERCCHRHR